MTSQLLSESTIGHVKSFLGYVLPPFVCQYAMAVLVQHEDTRLYRIALLPIVLWLAWRATYVEMPDGNPVLATQMYAIGTRSTTWALARKRYQRVSSARTSTFWNALDLLFNPRGLGWNWPRGLVVRRSEYSSRTAFVLGMLPRMALNAFAFDVCVQSIRALGPSTIGSPQGGTLFDHTLPPGLEYARAVLVAILSAWFPYFGIQYVHQLLAIGCVVVFQQRPSDWPPLFDAPWKSCSLAELWGRRWHQMMRDMVISLGAEPVGWVFGRLGGVVGAFLVSGLFHDAELRASGRGGCTVVMIGFWVMNGVGIVLERVWTRTTGRRVGGFWGRVWLATWLLMWGIPMVDGYARIGRFSKMSLLGEFEPSRTLVEWFLHWQN